MELIEQITWNDKTMACIIRAAIEPDVTTFVTPQHHNLQVGFVVYPAGGVIARHVHLPLERHIVGTSEVLVLRKGSCAVDIYSPDRQLIATCELRQGDVLLMTGGGHGFRMLRDTVFLEIKQGPYTGLDEKERF